MKVRLLKTVLTSGGSNVLPTPRGTVVDMTDDEGREFVANVLAEEVGAATKAAAKAVPAPAPAARSTKGR